MPVWLGAEVQTLLSREEEVMLLQLPTGDWVNANQVCCVRTWITDGITDVGMMCPSYSVEVATTRSTVILLCKSLEEAVKLRDDLSAKINQKLLAGLSIPFSLPVPGMLIPPIPLEVEPDKPSNEELDYKHAEPGCS